MNEVKKKISYKTIVCNIFLTILIYVVLCMVTNVYPFGSKSNMMWDLNIQYVDYFAYFKQVLSGNAHIGYTFLKSLGGNAIGIFGYYLASPLNLLVVFFDIENLQMFVFVITLIKLVLIAVAFNFFLNERFKNLDKGYVIIATMSFVFSQYVIGQMTNIMWLDGVYLLPIMMWGVYKFVWEDKKGVLFITVAISILFNWYTGYMNCLFIPFYFLLEECLKERNENKLQLKVLTLKGIRFCIIEAGGVLASSALFLPVVYCLLQGKGQMEDNIFQFVTNGNLLEILNGFMIGHVGNNTHIILYCSEFIFLAVILFFMNEKIKKYEKKYIALLLLFLIAGCFFKPLENVWNGFRYATSYYYRFSYIATIMLVYTAVYGLNIQKRLYSKKMTKIVAGIIGIWLLEDLIQKTDEKYLWLSILIMVIYGALFAYSRNKEKVCKNLIYIIVFVEIVLNGRYIMMTTYTNDAKDYQKYVTNEQALITKIKQEDKSWYRIDETTKRAGIANVNEGMAYNYYSIAHYSSAYDVEVSRFLTNMGYNTNVNVTTFDEPILPVDSLLGLKYLLSESEYAGYEKLSSYVAGNGKEVYKNNYALNLVIPVAGSITKELNGENPFDRINDLYSKILGYQVEIFKPIDNVIREVEDGSIEITTVGNNANGIVYGCMNSDISDVTLSVDGNERCTYNGWLSRYVFNIGKSNEIHQIKFKKNEELTSDRVQYKCYYLDLDKFQEIIEGLQNISIKNEKVEDGNVSFVYQCNTDGKIMLSVPYEQGWNATVNGKKVTIEKGAATFIVLPVNKGMNKIVLKYTIPWLKQGIAVSIITIGIFLFIWYLEIRKKKLMER